MRRLLGASRHAAVANARIGSRTAATDAGAASRTAATLAGAAAIVVYLATASLSFRAGLTPVRPLYEGTAPPPRYNWVAPPPDLADGNVAPSPASQSIAIRKGVSQAGTVATEDGQAVISFPDGAFTVEAGATEVKVQMTPLDAKRIGSPPGSLLFDGNAYRIEAQLVPSGAPAQMAATTCAATAGEPKRCATMVLRYSTVADTLLRRDATGWVTEPSAHNAVASLQIFADVARLGTYAVAGPFGKVQRPGSNLTTIIGLVLGLIAVIAAVVAARKPGWRKRFRKGFRKMRRWLKA